MNLRYTLVFITDHRERQEWILLLLRKHHPNQGLWNGVGGKIRPGERPIDCAIREAREETGICEVDNIRFAGVVTWPEGEVRGGMYVYVSHLPVLEWENWGRFEGKETEEGRLQWWPLDGLADLECDMVSNIPQFLAPMLDGEPPMEYRCFYDSEDNLSSVEEHPLTINLEGVV